MKNKQSGIISGMTNDIQGDVWMLIDNDYNLQESLKYAEGFSPDDISEILKQSDGENDGPDWCFLFQLRDGRYAYLQAGCDYTGWG